MSSLLPNALGRVCIMVCILGDTHLTAFLSCIWCHCSNAQYTLLFSHGNAEGTAVKRMLIL